MAIKKYKSKNKEIEKSVIIILPLFLMLERKRVPDKKIIINFNNFPHWHHYTYNEIKVEYTKLLKNKLIDLDLGKEIKIIYTLFKGTNRISDKMNVLAVQDKFFCDALTEHKCIEDDNDEIILTQTFERTILDKENPRVEAEIIYKI